MTIRRAQLSVAASQTDSEVIAAVAGHKIRVKAMLLKCGGTATTIKFGSKIGAEATVDLTPAFTSGVNDTIPLPKNEDGWFETEAGAALTATTGAGSTHTGLLIYTLVKDGREV